MFPARPRKPRDKAKVEVAVQIAQRWIVARLRNEAFATLEQLNARIAELLEELNAREMRKYGASRRELFERLDRTRGAISVVDSRRCPSTCRRRTRST